MGRYYTTSTGNSGKFCFSTQSSTAPEKFGMSENTAYIHYRIDEDEFDMEYYIKLCEEFGVKLNHDPDEEKYKELPNVNACDLYLGAVIYQDILEQGYCELEAEI